MESQPQEMGLPGWQDIAQRLIIEKINEGKLDDALFLCHTRKSALEGVVQDMDGVSNNTAEWTASRNEMLEEIEGLGTVITEIEAKVDAAK